MPDPKAEICRLEVQAVLKKHEMMGIVVIASPTHSSFAMVSDTPWSCCQDVPEGFRIRSKRAEFETAEEHQKVTTATIGAIGLLRDSVSTLLISLNMLMHRLGKAVEITGENRIENPDGRS